MNTPFRIVALVVVVILVTVSVAAKRKRRARPRPAVSAQVDTLHTGSANGFVSIPFTLQRLSNVELVVSDVAGRPVRSLVSGTRLAGSHLVTWDGRDERGNVQDAGFHFAKLRVDGKVISTHRIVVVQP
jgi:hypothetical protein